MQGSKLEDNVSKQDCEPMDLAKKRLESLDSFYALMRPGSVEATKTQLRGA